MTSPTTFSIREVLNTAWLKVKGAKLTFFLLAITLAVLQFFNETMITYVPKMNPHFAQQAAALTFFAMLSSILIIFLHASTYYFGVKRAMDDEIHYSMLKNLFTLRIFIHLLGTIIFLIFILFLPITIFSSIMLLLSGGNPESLDSLIRLGTALVYLIGFFWVIYFGLRLSFAVPLLMVNRLTAGRALKVSFRATKSHLFKISLLLIIQSFIVLGTGITLGIALIWIFPWMSIMWGEVYKKLIFENPEFGLSGPV